MADLPNGTQTQGLADTAGWTAWTPAQRESFLDAIARHRRAAWRVTLASRVINFAAALVVAVLMSPLFYGALALFLDLLNLVIPTPNLVPRAAHAIGTVFSDPGETTLAARFQLVALAALPGLIWMAFVLSALRRVLSLCMSFESGELATRAPDLAVLAEQRFGNVVSEMAIAANIARPGVYVMDSPAVDAVAFGVDERHSTIVISRGLLSLLNRAQMEGVAASLIGSIADGDMAIGVRAALSLSLFSLITRLGSVVSKTHARRDLSHLVKATLLPTAASARKLISDLASPFADGDDDPPRSRPDPATGLAARWQSIRTYLWLPLAGPLVMTGFLGALFNLFVLGPLLAIAWRQRKYMADATAVRLTRDPDTLSGALEQMSRQRTEPLIPWASHLSVVGHSGRQGGVFGASAVPMFPSIDRRLRALGTLGAHINRKAGPRIPLRLWLIAVPLLALMAVLVAILFPMLIWLSLALTALFSGIPFAIVHTLLRWLGHH